MNRARLASILILTAALLTGCGGDKSSDIPNPGTDPADNPTQTAPGGGLVAEREGDESGVLVHNGQRMVVKSAIAVWNAEEKELDIDLLPFEPTEADIERCRKDETMFMLDGKQAEGFSDRVPYGTYTFWGDQMGGVKNAAEAYHAIHAHFLGEPGSNISLNYPSNEHSTSLEGSLEPGSEIVLRSKGRDTSLGDHDMSWDLELRAKVYIANAQ